MKRPVALITGAARRIGRTLALQLARSGYDVLFTYHNSTGEAESLVLELKASGVSAAAYQVDLTSLPGAVEALAEEVADAVPALDVLINNASIYLPDAELDEDFAGRLWRIHVTAPLLLSRTFAPQLAAAHGCVINMCDILADRPMRGYLAYCASKAGLVNLTKGLARELAPDVRVNGISPGVAEWPSDFPEEQKEKLIRRIPLRRAGTPQDIAEAAMFLINSPYITGQILPVDGGRSIA